MSIIWRLLDHEGLTACKSSVSTYFFSVDELSKYYSRVSSVHSPCSVAELDDIITNTQSTVPFTFNFTPIDLQTVEKLQKQFLLNLKVEVRTRYLANILATSFLLYLLTLQIYSICLSLHRLTRILGKRAI